MKSMKNKVGFLKTISKDIYLLISCEIVLNIFLRVLACGADLSAYMAEILKNEGMYTIRVATWSNTTLSPIVVGILYYDKKYKNIKTSCLYRIGRKKWLTRVCGEVLMVLEISFISSISIWIFTKNIDGAIANIAIGVILMLFSGACLLIILGLKMTLKNDAIVFLVGCLLVIGIPFTVLNFNI